MGDAKIILKSNSHSASSPVCSTKRTDFESAFEFEAKARRAGPKPALPALPTSRYSFLWQLPSAASGCSCFPPNCALDAGARHTFAMQLLAAAST